MLAFEFINEQEIPVRIESEVLFVAYCKKVIKEIQISKK